jgi:hypothetical protein
MKAKNAVWPPIGYAAAGYPLVWVPCLVLLAGAAILGSTRRQVLAILALMVAAAPP